MMETGHDQVLEMVAVSVNFTVTAYPADGKWVIVVAGITPEAFLQLSQRVRKALVDDALRRAGYIYE